VKALLLNGPPKSGKDYIGQRLEWLIHRSARQKFADPIVDFMIRQFGVDMATVNKDVPDARLNGRTPREVAIGYSEKFCKPLFGIDHFGRLALQKIQWFVHAKQDLVIFTDSGFVSEAGPIADVYPTLQVVISRPGTTFQGDSRSHWESPKIGRILFDNDVTGPEKIQNELLPEIKAWLAK
jgi:hypothetical protein